MVCHRSSSSSEDTALAVSEGRLTVEFSRCTYCWRDSPRRFHRFLNRIDNGSRESQRLAVTFEMIFMREKIYSDWLGKLLVACALEKPHIYWEVSDRPGSSVGRACDSKSQCRRVRFVCVITIPYLDHDCSCTLLSLFTHFSLIVPQSPSFADGAPKFASLSML